MDSKDNLAETFLGNFIKKQEKSDYLNITQSKIKLFLFAFSIIQLRRL